MISPASPNWIHPLGSTGLAVSAVCVGGAPLGSMPENFGHEVAYQDAVTLVRTILESPIRWIDTANGYSGGESERRIGDGIAAYGGLPADFLIATKVDAKGKDYSGDRVRASVHESKERLRLPHLPLVYLHDPEYHNFDELSRAGGAIEALQALKSAGEIGHIGLAGGNVHEMSRYLALGVFEVILIHNRWTLVDRSAGLLIQQARQHGVAVVNAAIYGGGILAQPRDQTTYGYQPATQETLNAVGAMDEVCQRAGTSLAAAALQASVSDPSVDATIVGISKPTRLQQLLAGLSQELPAELFARLEELVPAKTNWLDYQQQN